MFKTRQHHTLHENTFQQKKAKTTPYGNQSTDLHMYTRFKSIYN